MSTIVLVGLLLFCMVARHSSCVYIDIDECESGDHNCQHFCTNTEGGFDCSCEVGYELVDDDTVIAKCEGKIKQYAYAFIVIIIT